MPNRSFVGVARVAVGAAISLAAVVVVIHGVDLGRTASILGHASLGWLALVIVLQSIDVTLRAVRWQRLVAPIRAVSLLSMLGYLLVGYLANNLLPARLGELVRSHYIGDREGISRASALGTVVVERVVDTAVVVIIGAVAILVLHVRGVVASAVLVGLAVTALLVLALLLAVAAHRLPGAARFAVAIERWPKVASLGRRLRAGLAVARRPRTLAEAVGLSFGAWGASILAFAAAGQAIGLHLTMGEAALLVAGVALATAIPSGPGYLGTFELAAVTIGTTLGLPAEQAFALALLSHASVIILTSAGGAVAFIRLGWQRSAHEVGEVARNAGEDDVLHESRVHEPQLDEPQLHEPRGTDRPAVGIAPATLQAPARRSPK